MEIGKIYVDHEDGPNDWFGLSQGCKKGAFGFPDNSWRWSVINSEIVINYPRIDNYYGRRLATPEELKKIEVILGRLGYTLDPGTLEIHEMPVKDDVSRIIEKLEKGNWDLLKETEKTRIIEILKDYDNN